MVRKKINTVLRKKSERLISYRAGGVTIFHFTEERKIITLFKCTTSKEFQFFNVSTIFNKQQKQFLTTVYKSPGLN